MDQWAKHTAQILLVLGFPSSEQFFAPFLLPSKCSHENRLLHIKTKISTDGGIVAGAKWEMPAGSLGRNN